MRPDARIAELLSQQGVILRREHPDLASSLQRRVHAGELVSILPGVYTIPQLAQDQRTLVAGLARAHPETIVTGATAARLSYWPEAPMPAVSATIGRDRAPRQGFCWERRTIPPELVMVRGGIRMTTPSLTALDLCDLERTEALDVALRKRVVTVESLRHALELTAYRRGNVGRWAVVIDSRTGGWSYPERVGHRLLRRAGIDGWDANLPFQVAGGELYYIDIAFRRRMLAIEIDGRIHATDLQVFESDRWRQNDLVAAGWTVYRFTYAMVMNHPEMFVRTIRQALR
jgi:very-short-patch-repair endonuclease